MGLENDDEAKGSCFTLDKTWSRKVRKYFSVGGQLASRCGVAAEIWS